MVNHKRLPSDDAAGPLPPRKSTRLATNAVASLTTTPRSGGGDDSSGPSKTATPRPDGDDSSGPSKTATTRPGGGDDSSGPSKRGQKDSSQGKCLSGPALVQEVAKMVKNKDNAELMVLELMRRYSFDLSLLQKLLRQNDLNVSFSKVRYVDIAPLVGLDPRVKGDDIPTFEMPCARLPNSIFSIIVSNLQRLEAQYGRVEKHVNEETRSRYLAGYFNAIVALFSGIVLNTPETILEGRIATKGRIEYQFQTYGGVTIVFIEVKLEIGGLTERLNCVAQVIAKCDACAWMNHQNGYDVPILAILCDGKGFHFYRFVNKLHAKASPQLFLGEFPDGSTRIDLDDSSRKGGLSLETFIKRLRRACDTFYYVFLSGYRTGLEAYWKSGAEKGKAQGKARGSTPRWHKAMVHATQALEEAISAWNLYNEGKLDESKASGEKAGQLLAESVGEAPFVEKTLLSDFPEEMESVLDL